MIPRGLIPSLILSSLLSCASWLSGELDMSELGQLMSKMGFTLSNKRLAELMQQYDVDLGGKIELPEFLLLLKAQHAEAVARIQEMTQSPVMALRSDKSTRYQPPLTGVLHIGVTDGFARKKHYRVMTACDREYISEVVGEVGGSGASQQMLASSLQGTKLRLGKRRASICVRACVFVIWVMVTA